MAFDFKKEYREYYLPPQTPVIVVIPPMNYVAVRGKGNPNDEDSEYRASGSTSGPDEGRYPRLYPLAPAVLRIRAGRPAGDLPRLRHQGPPAAQSKNASVRIERGYESRN